MYGQGESLHVAVWPGSIRNTQDITPFLAKEGRSYSLAVSSVMRIEDIPSDTPLYSEMLETAPEHGVLANGGSCLCDPSGEFLIQPVINDEGVFSQQIDLTRVMEERQNFDPAGHYSRPDVTKLIINSERASTIKRE